MVPYPDLVGAERARELVAKAVNDSIEAHQLSVRGKSAGFVKPDDV